MIHGQQRLESPKKKNKIIVFEVLAVLYIMHSLLPAVGYYMPGIVYLGVFGLTFLFALPAFTRKGAYMMLGFFVVSLLTLFLKLNNIAGAAIYLYGELQVYLFGLIALTIVAYGDPKQSRRMFWLILVMYAITAVTTIIGNDKYPQASRFLATLPSNDPMYQMYTRENIGSFTLAYGLVLITPLVIYLTRTKKVNVFIGAGMLGLCGFTIFSMEYGMATLLFVACLILLLIPKPTTKKIIIIVLTLLVFMVIFGGVVAKIFESISLTVSSDALSERFMTVAEVLRGDDQTSSASAQNRTELYGKSLSAFWDSSLMGTWDESMWGSAGGHSYILDTLGKFGLIGIVALIILFVTMYNLSLKPYKRQTVHPYLFWTYLLAVVLMVLNPKIYGLTFLLVLPLFGHAFGDYERSNAV